MIYNLRCWNQNIPPPGQQGMSFEAPSWSNCLGQFFTLMEEWPEIRVYTKEDPHNPVLTFKHYAEQK